MINQETVLKLKQEVGENSIILIGKLKSDGTTQGFITTQTMRTEMVISFLDQMKFQLLHQLFNNTKAMVEDEK